MLPRRRLRLAASGGVLLALLGVWLGHTAEYVRVAGVAGLREELVGSLHWYMAPVGVALALVAALAAVGAWRIWTRLGDELAAARHALARSWRGDVREDDRPKAAVTANPYPGLRLRRLWPLLALGQIGLYLLQENLEAVAADVPAPGLGAVTGAHWAASLVHVAVALLLTAIVGSVRRALQRRSRAVGSTHALLRVLLAVALRRVETRPATSLRVSRPADRFGRLWCRPPPPLLVTG